MARRRRLGSGQCSVATTCGIVLQAKDGMLPVSEKRAEMLRYVNEIRRMRDELDAGLTRTDGTAGQPISNAHSLQGKPDPATVTGGGHFA